MYWRYLEDMVDSCYRAEPGRVLLVDVHLQICLVASSGRIANFLAGRDIVKGAEMVGVCLLQEVLLK